MQLYKRVNPVVSVIIPTFNRAELLKRAVSSVLGQTFRNFELIIIDDGSDDNTFEYVKELALKHDFVKYAFHKNRGIAITENTGLRLSAGKYITFLGSDDEYKPNHIELRVKYMEKRVFVDMIHGGIEVIGDPFVPDKNDVTQKIHLDDCVVGGTFFGKRSTFMRFNGFNDVEFSEDSDFYERIKDVCTIEKVEYKTYIYHRDVPDSICNTIF